MHNEQLSHVARPCIKVRILPFQFSVATELLPKGVPQLSPWASLLAPLGLLRTGVTRYPC